MLAAWLVGGVVAGILAIGMGYNPADHPGGLAITLLGQSAAALAMVWSISRNWGSGSLRTDLGLEFRARDTVGIVLGLGLQVAAALLVSPLVRFLSDDFETQQQVADLAEATNDAGGRITLILMVVLVAPFIEEVIFRGVVLIWLARYMHVGWAIVISSAAFAAVHLADPNAVLAVPSLFIVGLGLGWAVRWRGNIGIAIYMHAGVNLLGAVFLMWGDQVLDYLEELEQALQTAATLLGLG